MLKLVYAQRALKLPIVVHLMDRIHSIVTPPIRQSANASHTLNKKQKLLNLPEHRLMTDVVERRNSACDMLEQLFKQQPAICAALLSAEVWENVKELWALAEADLVYAKDVTTSWKPLDVATHTTLEEKTPSGLPRHSAHTRHLRRRLKTLHLGKEGTWILGRET